MITKEYLKTKIEYNSQTGEFTWLVNNRSVKRGDRAGYNNSEYRVVQIDGKCYPEHNLAWLYYYGIWPENIIDHIDLNGFNNKIDNLRLATVQENSYNKPIYKNNKSGVKGVYWKTSISKWRAKIKADGKEIFLGYFDDLDKAKYVVQEAREIYHKQFKNNG